MPSSSSSSSSCSPMPRVLEINRDTKSYVSAVSYVMGHVSSYEPHSHWKPGLTACSKSPPPQPGRKVSSAPVLRSVLNSQHQLISLLQEILLLVNLGVTWVTEHAGKSGSVINRQGGYS